MFKLVLHACVWACLLTTQRNHSLFGTVLSKLTLHRSAPTQNRSYSLSDPSAKFYLGGESNGELSSGERCKLTMTKSLHCSKSKKSAVTQKLVNDRHLLPLAVVASPYVTVSDKITIFNYLKYIF